MSLKFCLILSLLLGFSLAQTTNEPGSGGCPLTTEIEQDWLEITQDAEEMGWYEDGYVDLDAVK